MQITNIHQNISKADFLKAINREDFVEPQKGDGEYAVSLQISEEAQKRFDAEIIHFDRRIDMPEYCGIYKTDKAIATAVENCSKEERIFVYDTIRQNFLRENTASFTEEERQAIASAGRADKNGNMNYGLTKASYLGHGSNLVATTNTVDMMKNMDSAAYQEYQRILADGSNEDRLMDATKYMTNWYIDAVKEKPGVVERYEKINPTIEKEVNDKELSRHFDGIDISSKGTFLEGLRNFMSRNQNFMTGVLSLELSNRFWKS